MLILLTSLVGSSVGRVTAAQFKSVERKKSLVFLLLQGPFHLLFLFQRWAHVTIVISSMWKISWRTGTVTAAGAIGSNWEITSLRASDISLHSSHERAPRAPLHPPLHNAQVPLPTSVLFFKLTLLGINSSLIVSPGLLFCWQGGAQRSADGNNTLVLVSICCCRWRFLMFFTPTESYIQKPFNVSYSVLWHWDILFYFRSYGKLRCTSYCYIDSTECRYFTWGERRWAASHT